MPNSYSNIDQAYILPQDNSLSNAQKLSFIQNERQLDEQRQQRLYEKQQQQEGRNLNTISDELNFDKYKTGEQAIDNYSQSELQKIYNEALKSHIDDNPANLEGWLQQNLQPLAKWDVMAKNAYANLDKTLQDYNKTYPNIDYSKARGIALNQFQNDFLEPDANGQITRKNTDQIQPSDYAGLLQSPDVLGQVTNDTSEFDKYFYNIPRTSVGDKQYTNKQGHVNSFQWSGLMPEGIGEVQTDADNKPIGIQLRGDTIQGVTDAQGNPMKTLPLDIAQRLRSNPAVYAASLKKWYDAKPAIEQAYMQQTGKPLTKDIDNMLMGSYLYNEANKLIAHPLKTEEIQKEPKAPVVNIYNGKDVGINDIASQVDEVLTQTNNNPAPLTSLPSEAREYFTKSVNAGRNSDSQLSPDDLTVIKGNDGSYRILNNANDGDIVGVFSKTGINLKANTNQKQKQVILHNQQSTGKKK